MVFIINRIVLDTPSTWNRTRFEATRTKYRQARKLIETSINVQFAKQLKDFCLQNNIIKKTIIEINQNLFEHKNKLHIFDNLTELAVQSLPNHLNKRIENIRHILEKHCNAIKKVLHEENEYWKVMHSTIISNNFRAINKNKNHLELSNKNSSIKNKRISIVLLKRKSNQILPCVNETYIVNHEESPNIYSSELSFKQTQVLPIYTEPNLPIPINFSATILQEEGEEESQSNRDIISSFDQNQTDHECLQFMEPKIMLDRLTHTDLLKYGINDTHFQHQDSFDIPESLSKRQTRSRKKTKSESIRKRKTRKRKQSKSENTITLRKRKSVSILKPERPTLRQRRNNTTKKNNISIREPSPLPIIDPSNHYRNRFSTRFQRLNDITLSMVNIDSNDDSTELEYDCRSRKKSSRLTRSKKH
ncbi:unnamed protein product [Adineta steineri]|uniref:Uncharacterized protein n=1 Tax=Adineta steineri TaxID=433720 RepID=A0A818SAC2_9BILA|nr:unnamed protein product [Adineta steineri]CAF3666787.1 unnamed protein product [Adineta steineri]